MLQGHEFATPPERVADIGHRAFHPQFVLRFPRAGGVDQGAVVLGQLGIGAIDLRVVQIRLVHPGLEVVRHQPGRDPAEELERGHVRLGPGTLIHPQHRAHEQQP